MLNRRTVGLAGLVLTASTVLVGCPLFAGFGWFRYYESTGDSAAFGAARTVDGGYAVAGYIEPEAMEDNNALLVKLNKKGFEEWRAEFGDEREDAALDVHQTRDLGYILAGRFGGESDPTSDGFLLKTDRNGDEEWRAIIDSKGEDWAVSVDPARGGGYIVGAQLDILGDPMAAVIKFDNNGNEVWRETIETGAHVAEAHATLDGGAVLVAWRLFPAIEKQFEASGQVEVLKVDENGDEVWRETFDSETAIEVQSVDCTLDGGTVLCGQLDFLADDSSLFLWKIDGDGILVWQQDYAQDGREIGHSVRATTDRGYVVAGEVHIDGEAGHGLIIKTDAEGNEIWRRAYGGGAFDAFYAVVPLLDYGAFAAGLTESYQGDDETLHSEIFVVKTNAGGDVPLVQIPLE